jgi:hypothetical protein
VRCGGGAVSSGGKPDPAAVPPRVAPQTAADATVNAVITRGGAVPRERWERSAVARKPEAAFRSMGSIPFRVNVGSGYEGRRGLGCFTTT